MIEKISEAWAWLNGRKTTIGAFLAVLYVGALSQGYIQPNEAVEFFITVVLGVGLAHKVKKAK